MLKITCRSCAIPLGIRDLEDSLKHICSEQTSFSKYIYYEYKDHSVNMNPLGVVPGATSSLKVVPGATFSETIKKGFFLNKSTRWVDENKLDARYKDTLRALGDACLF
ncbi:hypothetical protein L1987_30020 [Smallanthus sonchifolius]|uniref:Uncharacterized protein n=1 Tax=Smallanthus sonchifolius TaxID=185202 RepID=A0ACB9I2U7_9ASTR|nr:hypothetical protein L1987_30020 [Smallanthus sonchifolius]